MNFFNVADETLSPYLTKQEYEKSLIHNILFQDKVLIDEGMLGDSSFVLDSILAAKTSGKPSLFLEAIARGIIVPAMRKPGIANMYDRWKRWYTDAFPIFTDRYRLAVIGPLTQALEEAEIAGHKPALWPTHTTREEEYERVLKQYLQGQPPDWSGNPEMEALWDNTQDLRGPVIDEARSQTAKGISRTKLVNAVAKRFDLPEDSMGAHVPQLVNDQGMQSKTAAFLRWITQCHHLATAQFFAGTVNGQMATNHPIYSLKTDFVGQEHYGIIQTEAPTDADPRVLRIEVLFPTPEKLMKIPPEVLFKARKGAGATYFLAMEEWARKPTGATHSAAEAALKDYAKWLGGEPGDESVYNLIAPTTLNRSKVFTGLAIGAVGPALALVGGTLEPIGVATAALSLIGGHVLAYEEWWMRMLRIDAGIKQRIEFTLPVPQHKK